MCLDIVLERQQLYLKKKKEKEKKKDGAEFCSDIVSTTLLEDILFEEILVQKNFECVIRSEVALCD